MACNTVHSQFGPVEPGDAQDQFSMLWYKMIVTFMDDGFHQTFCFRGDCGLCNLEHCYNSTT
jgi:hypothetical protein